MKRQWPSISVCMIVKDESDNLRPCLESLGDLPSEIIVVDTGSTDDTVAIARALGAKVHSFRWVDDFSAARNESLHHATGDWIFWLDADDRLSPQAVADLKQAAASGKADAYGCQVSSTKPNGSRDVVEHIRLFRNGRGIRFSGAIHETVAPDLLRLGLRLGDTDVEVQHTGYESPQITRRKSERNLPIIDRELSLHPERLDLLFYRGHCRRGVGDVDGSAADMREFLARSRPGANFGWSRFWAYTAIAFILEGQGKHEELEALLQAALAEFPGHPQLLFMSGRLSLLQGQPDSAIQMLLSAHAALRSGGRGLVPSRAAVSLNLAQACRTAGKSEEALRWAGQARDHAPQWMEAATFLALLYVESSRHQQAEGLLRPILASTETPEPWLVLAELRQRQGEWQEAEQAIQEARSRGLPEDRVRRAEAKLKSDRLLATGGAGSSGESDAQLRGLALLRRGDYLRSAEAFAEAMQASPSDPDNYRYLAVALEKAGHTEEAVQAWRLAEQWKSRGREGS